MTTQKEKNKPKKSAVILPAQGAPLLHMLCTQQEVHVNMCLVNPGNSAGLWAARCKGIFLGDRDTGHARVAPLPGEKLARHRKPSSAETVSVLTHYTQER